MTEPVVPDFTPVTIEEFCAHLDGCPAGCRGPGGGLCPVGKALSEKLIAQGRALRERAHKTQAWDLIRAGWRFVLPASPDPPVMSWYWRAPPRRKGSAGRKYQSTNQAWRAMKRMAGEDPDEEGRGDRP